MAMAESFCSSMHMRHGCMHGKCMVAFISIPPCPNTASCSVGVAEYIQTTHTFPARGYTTLQSAKTRDTDPAHKAGGAARAVRAPRGRIPGQATTQGGATPACLSSLHVHLSQKRPSEGNGDLSNEENTRGSASIPAVSLQHHAVSEALNCFLALQNWVRS